MPSASRRVALCVAPFLAVLASAGSAHAAEPSCRADAARVTVGDVALADPVVANAGETPCRTDRASVADVRTIGPLTVQAPEAATRREAGLAAASAGAAGAQVQLGPVSVSVGVVRSSQVAVCVNGAGVVDGESRVDSLVVGGNTVPIVADRPIDVNVGVVRVRANQVSGGTRTALILDALGTQVVLGEARVAGDPCAALAGTDPAGGGGGGTGGGGSGGICPTGSSYDAARGMCVIYTGTGASVAAVDVGRPFEGPAGGKVVSLDAARRMAAAGKLSDSPCLRGAGPRYVIVGTGKADRITGTDGPDRIIAGGGADRVDGGRGNDCLDGGSGRDVLSGALGADRVYGTTGNDAVNGGSGADLLAGGLGNDTINAGFGRDRIDGGPGRDAINAATAGPASVRITCGSGQDTVRANRNERSRLRGCERAAFIR